VLGDLEERYTSPLSYLVDGFSVLGPVIISRIRRTTDIQVFLMETLTIYLSFTATSWWLGERGFLFDHAGFVRLALPTSVAVVALLFCNAYSDPRRTSHIKPLLQSVGSISLGFLGQAVIFDMYANFAVPFRIMLFGSLLSVLLVSPLRVLFPPAQRLTKFAYPREQRLFQDRYAKLWHNQFNTLTRTSLKVRWRSKWITVAAFLIALITFAVLFAPAPWAEVPKPQFVVLALVAFLVAYRNQNK
jgi:hypothetical protein